MPVVDDPRVEGSVYYHGGRWVDANGNEVDNETARRVRLQVKKAKINAPVTHEAPPDEPEEDEEYDDDEDVVDYSGMSKDRLIQEINARNVDRAEEDLIPVTGNKGDLVAALEEDDEAE